MKDWIKKLTTTGLTVYRGTLKELRNREFNSDPGDFGRGEYWTSSLVRAKCYGNIVKEISLVLANPKILNVSDAYELADQYKTVGPNLSVEERIQNAQRMTDALLSQGFDSLVSINERMQEIEIVVYKRKVDG